MTDDNTRAGTPARPASPNPDLKSFERLIGTWSVSGESQGTVRYDLRQGRYVRIYKVCSQQSDRALPVE